MNRKPKYKEDDPAIAYPARHYDFELGAVVWWQIDTAATCIENLLCDPVIHAPTEYEWMGGEHTQGETPWAVLYPFWSHLPRPSLLNDQS